LFEFSDQFAKLGQGEHGAVYVGKLEYGDLKVAVKTSTFNSSRDAVKYLLSELKILIFVGKHPNVLKLLGANTTDMRKGSKFY